MLDTYSAHVTFGDGEHSWHYVHEVFMESAHFFSIKKHQIFINRGVSHYIASTELCDLGLINHNSQILN